jgi:hypothetical protein
MLIALVFFALSLFGIIVLFAHKAWELRTERVLAPVMRERADERAELFKQLLERGQREFRRLPPALVDLSRTILHDAALGAAATARFLERQSHRLADLVSHKRTFERRETTSEFLKSVSSYKNESGLDPEDQNR